MSFTIIIVLKPMESPMKKTKQQCLTVIKSNLYKLLCNLVSPAEGTFEQLTAVIKQHLVHKPIVTAGRITFYILYRSLVRAFQHIWHF